MKKFIYVYKMFLFISLIFSCSEDDTELQPQTVDKIETTLTTSKTTYQNANSGDWISITKEEFGDLSSNLLKVSKIGLEENLYPSNSEGLSGISNNSGATYSNETTATIPINSYVFAIRFYVGTGIFAQSKDNIIKVSDTNISEGYVNLGNLLPESTPVDREVFYVLKENTIITKSIGYIAINMRSANGLSIIQNDSYLTHRGFDDTVDLPFKIEGVQVVLQGLSTTEKQWN